MNLVIMNKEQHIKKLHTSHIIVVNFGMSIILVIHAITFVVVVVFIVVVVMDVVVLVVMMWVELILLGDWGLWQRH